MKVCGNYVDDNNNNNNLKSIIFIESWHKFEKFPIYRKQHAQRTHLTEKFGVNNNVIKKYEKVLREWASWHFAHSTERFTLYFRAGYKRVSEGDEKCNFHCHLSPSRKEKFSFLCLLFNFLTKYLFQKQKRRLARAPRRH